MKAALHIILVFLFAIVVTGCSFFIEQSCEAPYSVVDTLTIGDDNIQSLLYSNKAYWHNEIPYVSSEALHSALQGINPVIESFEDEEVGRKLYCVVLYAEKYMSDSCAIHVDGIRAMTLYSLDREYRDYKVCNYVKESGSDRFVRLSSLCTSAPFISSTSFMWIKDSILNQHGIDTKIVCLIFSKEQHDRIERDGYPKIKLSRNDTTYEAAIDNYVRQK